MARHQLTLRSQEKPMLGWATPPRLLGNGEGVGHGSCARTDGQAHWETWWFPLNPHWPSARWGDPRNSPRRLTHGKGAC